MSESHLSNMFFNMCVWPQKTTVINRTYINRFITKNQKKTETCKKVNINKHFQKTSKLSTYCRVKNIALCSRRAEPQGFHWTRGPNWPRGTPGISWGGRLRWNSCRIMMRITRQTRWSNYIIKKAIFDMNNIVSRTHPHTKQMISRFGGSLTTELTPPTSDNQD